MKAVDIPTSEENLEHLPDRGARATRRSRSSPRTGSTWSPARRASRCSPTPASGSRERSRHPRSAAHRRGCWCPRRVAVVFLALPLVAAARPHALGRLPDPAHRPRGARGAAALAGDLAGGDRRGQRGRGPAGLDAGAGRLPGPVPGPGPGRSSRWSCRRSSAASRCSPRSAGRGLVGGPLYDAIGISIPFTTIAVVLAHTFVALPFFVLSVEGALRAADREYDVVAATLGASRWTTFRRVDAAAGRARAARRPGARLGPGARRVRRHHHLRRQLPRHHPDDAAARSTSRCRATRTPPWCSA